MKRLITLCLTCLVALGASAQRSTDKISRGLVAVKKGSSVFCSWRIFGEEYYDTKYNIYRDGVKLNATPLSVSNYTDNGGTVNNKYTVEAVVRGVVQGQCDPVTPWANNYLDIKLQPVVSRSGQTITSYYEPNDVSVADLDGDGVVEILLKRRNNNDANSLYAESSTSYDIFEAYKLDGTRLWWIDCGPNMVSGSSVEVNIVAYDWDGDGKAEVVLRGADDMVIHKADGTTQTIGKAGVNTRNTVSHTANMTYTNSGAEYLIYMNGVTAEPYQVMTYPLTRGSASEWGDGYGHRSSKYFFGAPFLDGRRPSLFLARGIYTKHKMIAYDVDAATHKLVERWKWECSTSGSSWFGQGYHNYGIADVDCDGRDEITYGSMVIDDNGKGLSTTGLGHGDAQHCSDFDPYTPGLEMYCCNEDRPGNNYRNATTSEIYYRKSAGSDDGRAMMGKFTDDYPGCQGASAADGWISSVTHKSLNKNGGFDLNFQIYWDGDLCHESFNYSKFVTNNGYYEDGNPRIYKYGKGSIFSFANSKTCNGTKGTPSNQGDILGDWREEVILRTDDGNLRLFTTTDATQYRNYTLWHDHQYRQAMVWQMCGYNQPPHTSYYLGVSDNITIAPPPLTMTGRKEIENGGAIGSSTNDKHIITCETNDMTVSVADGATPYIYTDNAPTWVQGNDNNDKITKTVYTHTLTGGAFAGSMRLVKQGDGILRLPKVTQTYTGNTDVWAGTLAFDGVMAGSRVWLNRHTSLESDGGNFKKSIQADYNASILPGGANKVGTIETDSLLLNFGARLVVDLYSEGIAADKVKANVLKIEKKEWQYGPKYSTPVISVVSHPATGEEKLAAGRYLIGEIAKIDGDIANLLIEGLAGVKAQIAYEGGKLYIDVVGMRDATTVNWTGELNTTWDKGETTNFTTTGEDSEIFVDGDIVNFTDEAFVTDVTISQPLAPKSVVFLNNTKTYTINGDSLVGNGTIVKNGTADAYIRNENRISGGTIINNGALVVSQLANEEGVNYGALGGSNAAITINNGATLKTTNNIKTTQPVTIGEGGGTLFVNSGATLNLLTPVKSSKKAGLVKMGNGTLTLPMGNNYGKTYIYAGTINAEADLGGSTTFSDSVIFMGNATLNYNSNTYSYNADHSKVHVKGATAKLYLDARCEYYTRLSGNGTVILYPQGDISRTQIAGDWTDFTGVVDVECNGSLNSLNFMTGADLSNCTLNVGSGFTMNNSFSTSSSSSSSTNVRLGNVTGSGTLAGGGMYIIGCNNSDISFSGAFATKVQKVGTGTWNVNKAQPSIGNVTISEGTLSIRSTSVADLMGSTSSVAINSGATLMGQGGLPLITAKSGSTVIVGIGGDDFAGELKTTKNFTAQAGSVVNLNIKNANGLRTSYSRINSGMGLILNGTVNITLSPSYTPAIGDEFTLWTAAGTFSGKPTVILPELPAGMKWDDSELLTKNGVLKIVEGTTGINAASADEPVVCRLYTTSGVLVGEYKATVTTAVKTAQTMPVNHGTYILRLTNGKDMKAVKVVIGK